MVRKYQQQKNAKNHKPPKGLCGGSDSYHAYKLVIFFQNQPRMFVLINQLKSESCANTAGGRALLYCTVLGATRRTVRKKYFKNILRLFFGANTQKVCTFIHS